MLSFCCTGTRHPNLFSRNVMVDTFVGLAGCFCETSVKYYLRRCCNRMSSNPEIRKYWFSCRTTYYTRLPQTPLQNVIGKLSQHCESLDLIWSEWLQRSTQWLSFSHRDWSSVSVSQRRQRVTEWRQRVRQCPDWLTESHDSQISSVISARPLTLCRHL